MEHTKHLWRAALLIVLGAFLAITCRDFLIPSSFGAEGYYRADSRTEFMAQPLVHGAPDACQSCHAEQCETLAEGAHKSVSCETCHAPLSEHVKGGEKIAIMPYDKSVKLCAYCHRKLDARRSTFPQIDFDRHPADLLEDEAEEPDAPKDDVVTQPVRLKTCLGTCHIHHQ